MTGRETLLMFARLKNLPEARIGALVAAMLRQTSLLPYADVVAGAYSGGNTLFLALALALAFTLSRRVLGRQQAQALARHRAARIARDMNPNPHPYPHPRIQ